MPEDQFDANPEQVRSEALLIDVEGFEGPLDLLLALSRAQRVDLRRISVLRLAEQYLAFVAAAKRLRIELAADYLVMAAWLAYLKSRLLAPPGPTEEGPTGAELAARLAFQLERLEAMREAAAVLMARDRLGRDVFARGAPERPAAARIEHAASLVDLMRAYARITTREEFQPLHLARGPVFTMEAALERMRGLLACALDWTDLASWLPGDWTADPVRRRSATAASFAAALELAKSGRLDLRQDGPFRPLYLRVKGAAS